jgi:hypothetical protein
MTDSQQKLSTRIRQWVRKHDPEPFDNMPVRLEVLTVGIICLVGSWIVGAAAGTAPMTRIHGAVLGLSVYAAGELWLSKPVKES